MGIKGVIGAVLLGLSATTSNAAYVSDGKFEGSICTNYFLFQSCRIVSVDAVKGEDGRFFSLALNHEQVDEFTKGRCFQNLRKAGWVSRVIGVAAGSKPPVFYTKKADGQLSEIDPEYITFKCTEEK